MDVYKDAIKSGMEEYLEGLKRGLDGLTPTELRWQPTIHSNPILWTTWHMARTEDEWMNERIDDGNGLWLGHGWRERLGFVTEGSGAGDSLDTVRAMPDVAIETVITYYDAVREAALNVLSHLSEENFDKELKTSSGIRTLRWALGHLLVEESQHLGQIRYVRGMIRGLNG